MFMRKRHAVIFVLSGFLIGLGSLLSQYLFCLNNWNNDYKAQVFDTFYEYFISVSGGAIMYSIMMVLMPPLILILIHVLNRFVDK